MSVNPELEAAVAAEPLETTVRLVYADWLDENGDPDRAEFIRLQCRLAAMDPCETGGLCRANKLQGTDMACAACAARTTVRSRVHALGTDNWSRWLDDTLPADPFVRDNALFVYGAVVFPPTPRMYAQHRVAWQFSRGFVSELRGPWSYLCGALDRLLARFPVTTVKINGAPPVQTSRVGERRTRYSLDVHDRVESVVLPHSGDRPPRNQRVTATHQLLTKRWPKIPLDSWVLYGDTLYPEE